VFLTLNFVLGPGWLGQVLGMKGAGTFTDVSTSLPDIVDLSDTDFLLWKYVATLIETAKLRVNENETPSLMIMPVPTSDRDHPNSKNSPSMVRQLISKDEFLLFSMKSLVYETNSEDMPRLDFFSSKCHHLFDSSTSPLVLQVMSSTHVHSRVDLRQTPW
jgi:hypothetical protein